MGQTLVGVLDGWYAAAQACFAASTAPDGTPVLVSFGQPGQYEPNAIVAVMDCVSSPISRPTLGTQRSRELLLDTTITFSVYVPGGNEAAQPAADSLSKLIRLFEEYVRLSPNEKLGGACYDSWISGIQGITGSVAYDPESVAAGSPAPMGRVYEAPITGTAKIRY